MNCSWRCVRHEFEEFEEFEVLVLVKEHSHPADHTAVDMEQCRKSMKACITNGKPNQILMFST